MPKKCNDKGDSSSGDQREHRGEIERGGQYNPRCKVPVRGACGVLTETTQALDRGGDGNVATLREGFQQLARFRLQHALPGVDHGALGVVDHVH